MAMFNEALMHADLMEHVLRRDEGWLEAPEIEDTYERRRVYRAMLPEEIRSMSASSPYDELCRRAGGEVAKGAGMPRQQRTTAERGAETVRLQPQTGVLCAIGPRACGLAGKLSEKTEGSSFWCRGYECASGRPVTPSGNR